MVNTCPSTTFDRLTPLRGLHVKWIVKRIHIHLIQPFLESHAPVNLVARGASVGMLVGFTPTVGVQMYIVVVIWAISRYLFRFRFNLPIAVALVWLSNPVTMVPLYFMFLITGDWILEMMGWFAVERDFDHFKVLLMNGGPDVPQGLWNRVVHGFLLLFWEFGWPMAIGSILWAVPSAILAYPVVQYMLHRTRRVMAEKEGITYQEWQARHVRLD